MYLIKSLHYYKIKLSSRQKVIATKTVFCLWSNTLPKIGLIINKHWDLLQLSQKDSVKSVHAYKPTLAFKDICY